MNTLKEEIFNNKLKDIINIKTQIQMFIKFSYNAIYLLLSINKNAFLLLLKKVKLLIEKYCILNKILNIIIVSALTLLILKKLNILLKNVFFSVSFRKLLYNLIGIKTNKITYKELDTVKNYMINNRIKSTFFIKNLNNNSYDTRINIIDVSKKDSICNKSLNIYNKKYKLTYTNLNKIMIINNRILQEIKKYCKQCFKIIPNYLVDTKILQKHKYCMCKDKFISNSKYNYASKMNVNSYNNSKDIVFFEIILHFFKNKEYEKNIN